MNQITNINPITAKILNFYPHANNTGSADGTGNYLDTGSEPDYYYSVASRVDYNLTSKQQSFAHYVDSNRLQSKTNAYFLPVSGATLTYANQVIALGYINALNASTVAEAHVSWTRFVNTNFINSQGIVNATAVGMPNYLGDNLRDAANSFPNIAPTGYQAFADKSNIASHYDIYMVSGAISKLHGNHFFRGGGEYRW